MNILTHCPPSTKGVCHQSTIDHAFITVMVSCERECLIPRNCDGTICNSLGLVVDYHVALVASTGPNQSNQHKFRKPSPTAFRSRHNVYTSRSLAGNTLNYMCQRKSHCCVARGLRKLCTWSCVARTHACSFQEPTKFIKAYFAIFVNVCLLQEGVNRTLQSCIHS